MHVRDLLPPDEDAERTASVSAKRPAPRASPRPSPVKKPKPRENALGTAAAKAATHYLGHRPSGFRDDCSGFVMAAYARAGSPVSGSSKSLWEDARADGRVHHKKRPEPGDVAFFDNTYDRNGNGRRDDPLTHVAIVIELDASGTITLAHGGTSKGRTTMKMNLSHPDERSGPDGSIYNDWLRARRKGEPERGKYFSAQLFKGFASMEPR